MYDRCRNASSTSKSRVDWYSERRKRYRLHHSHNQRLPIAPDISNATVGIVATVIRLEERRLSLFAFLPRTVREIDSVTCANALFKRTVDSSVRH